MNEDLFLVYIEKIGKNLMDWYEYEFIFSENPDIVWGQNWEQMCPCVCGDLRPDKSTYSVVKRLKTQIPLKCAQENSCFSTHEFSAGKRNTLAENSFMRYIIHEKELFNNAKRTKIHAKNAKISDIQRHDRQTARRSPDDFRIRAERRRHHLSSKTRIL